MKAPENSADNYKVTYRRIRKAIGYLGLGLPFGLVLLSLVPFFNTSIQPSISDYYYTNFREIFTGILCAVSLFLVSYKGYTNRNIFENDNLLTNIAGIMALGVALFPTSPGESARKIYSLIPLDIDWLGYLHYGFALCFFLTLALISIRAFTLGQNKDAEIPLSRWNENRIYRFCGWCIIFFMAMVFICGLLDIPYATLICETFMLLAFGTSWLIKGRALGDKGNIGRILYRENN